MKNTHKLVEQYIPLANKLAYQKKKTLPKFVDIEEIKSAAYLGLVEAASRFKPKMGVKFSTFAYIRIFGSICDYIRSQGWIKKGDLRPVFSLEMSLNEQECCLKETIESRVDRFLDVIEYFDFITFNMNEDVKSIIKEYFIENYSMKDIGKKRNLSEGRISQLIKSQKNLIKKRLFEIMEIAA